MMLGTMTRDRKCIDAMSKRVGDYVQASRRRIIDERRSGDGDGADDAVSIGGELAMLNMMQQSVRNDAA